MPSTVIRYTWEEVVRDGLEYTLELDIHVDWSPFVPAKINCDPEDGHPAEGGDFEVTKIDLQEVYEVLANGDLFERPEENRPCPHSRRYWLERFEKEVEQGPGAEQFRDWVGEQLDDEEARVTEEDDIGEDRYGDSYGESHAR